MPEQTVFWANICMALSILLFADAVSKKNFQALAGWLCCFLWIAKSMGVFNA
jgi:hypothetical protein